MGFASSKLEVPLFAELYGYGPFLGRRNQGIHEDIFCRAASFEQNGERAIIIVSDLVTMDEQRARDVRSAIAQRLHINSDGIMLCATHTHSAPTISPGIGWGELNQEFVDNWIKTAVATALEAVTDEEAVSMHGGKVDLSRQLGKNRVFADGPTDPDIRWIRFKRQDGSSKLLLHNHGMHGVIFGPQMLYVSSDWSGTANRVIEERKLAENAMFLQGACGNINTEPVAVDFETGKKAITKLVKSYVNDLATGLGNDNEQNLCPFPLKSILKKHTLPHKAVTPSQLREKAKVLSNSYLCNRMEEMALYMEAGNSIEVQADLQSIRIGDLYIYALPGEPFYEIGHDIARKSPGKMAIISEVSNGNCRYFPTRETFEKFPDITSQAGSGYYEIHQGCGRFMPEYIDEIGDYIIDKCLKAGAKLS